LKFIYLYNNYSIFKNIKFLGLHKTPIVQLFKLQKSIKIPKYFTFEKKTIKKSTSFSNKIHQTFTLLYDKKFCCIGINTDCIAHTQDKMMSNHKKIKSLVSFEIVGIRNQGKITKISFLLGTELSKFSAWQRITT
jgi:hypothetical protein